MENVKTLIKRLGGPALVARRIREAHGSSLTHSAVCQWKQVPSDYVPALVALSIERDDPMTAEDIRPDIPWKLLADATK